MTIQGHVENGQIVLDQKAPLPEGMKVEIRLLNSDPQQNDAATLPTLYERYKNIIGQAKDLPSDFAENHDHYIHGAPKK